MAHPIVTRTLALVMVSLLLALAGGCSKEQKMARHLAKADDYFKEQKYDEAIIEYKNVIQIQGNHVHALKQLGLAYEASGEPVKALPYFGKVRDLSPGDLEVKLKLARLLAAGQQHDRARLELDAVLGKEPANPEALLILGDIVTRPEEVDDVLQRLQEVRDQIQDKVRYHLTLGMLHLRKKDPPSAEAAVRDALAANPQSVEAHLAMGDLALMRRDLSQAEEEYRAAAGFARPGSFARIKLADFFLLTRKTDEAKKTLQEALQADAGFFPARQRLAAIAFAENQHDEALKLLDPIFKKNPGDPEAKLLRGRVHLARQETPQALQDLGDVVRLAPSLAQARYFLALAHLQAKDETNARAELKEAVGLNPQLGEAQLLLAELDLRSGLNQQAAEAAMKLLDRDPKSFEGLLILAEAANTPETLREASRRLEAAGEEYKSRARYQLALGRLHSKLGDKGKAEKAFKEAVTREPDSPDARLALGDFFLSHNELAQAEQEYKAAAELAPPASIARVKLAELYILSRKPEAAKEILADILQSSPGYVPALRLMGRIVFDEKNFDEGWNIAGQLLAKDPTDAEGLLLRGKLHMVSNKVPEAVADMEAAARRQPGSYLVLQQLAMAYLRAGDIPKAKSSLEEATRLKPDLPQAVLTLAELDVRTGAFDSAVLSLEKLKTRYPESQPLLELLGRAALGKGDFRKASEVYQKLTAMDPDNAQLKFFYGVALRSQGKRVEARKLFHESLGASSSQVGSLAQMVSMDFEEGKPEVGLQRVKDAAAANPDAAMLRNLLGLIYLKLREPGPAEEAFLKAIEIDPMMVQSYLAVSRIYVESGRYDDALEKLRKAAELDSKNLGAVMMAGVIHQQKGDLGKAQEAYEQILETDDSFVPAANNLAYIYAENAGDLDKALKIIQRAREKASDDPHVADTLGWVLYRKGNYDWALAALQESAAKLPQSGEVQYHLGMTYAKLGEKEKAREALNKALELDPKLPQAGEAKRALEEL